MKLLLLFFPLALYGQLAPSCDASVVAGANLTCSALLSGGAPAALQVSWVLPASVGSPTISAGAASLTAGKQIQCNLTLCLVYGLNLLTIAPGEVLHASIPIPLTASGNISICLAGPVESDPNGNSIPVTLSPCAAVSISPSANKCDINGDGQMNATDVAAQVNGTLAIPKSAPDLNKDGTANILDVQIVVRAVLGLGCLAL